MCLRLIPKLTIAIALLLSFFSAGAQYIPFYTFTQNASGTYTPVSGGTVLGSGTGLANQRYAVTLPFPFYVDNVVQPNIYVAVNGYITFDTTANPGAGYYTINSSVTGFRAASGMDCDLAGQASTSEISYAATGSSPNRVFTVQWKNMGYNASTILTANFQIQLLEGTNEIRVVYGSTILTGTGSNIAVQVGLRGLNNSLYLTRSSATSAWTGTTAGSSSASNIAYQTGLNPPSGLTYTFSPPLCSAPAAQPTTLVFTPNFTSVNGSFTGSGANKYLVVRTPNVPLSIPPVNGTAYAVNAALGNGTVVAAGSGTSFSNTGLVKGTFYTYTIFAYNDANCVNAPVYRVIAPLTGTIQTLGPRAYAWQSNSGSADFSLANSWLPLRSNPDPDDTLIFGNGGTSTAINFAGANARYLWVSNNTNITLSSAGTYSLLIGDSLFVAVGSTLTLGGSSAITMGFSSTAAQKHATINGLLNMNGSCTFDNNYSLSQVNGTIAVNGASASVTNPSGLYFNAGSTYLHNRNGGSIPAAVYQAASTVKVTGITSTPPTITSGQDFGNFIWNCAAQSASVSITGAIDTIRGNMTVINTGSVSLTIAGIGGTVVVAGDLLQQAGTLQLNATTSKLRVLGNAGLSGGALFLNTTSTPATTFLLHGDLLQSAGHLLTKSSSGIPEISFAGNAHQHVIIGGTIAAVDISYSLNNPAGATLTGTLPIGTGATNTIAAGSWQGNGSFSYSGGSSGTGSTLLYSVPVSQNATGIEWPVTNGPYNVKLNLSGAEPDNRIYMPGSRTVQGALTLAKGVLVLNASDLTVVYNISGGTDSTSIIAADSTGQLIRTIPVLTSVTGQQYSWPIGDITGATESGTVYLQFFSNTAARSIGMRLRDRKHPADTSANNYLTRYWVVTDNGGSAAYTYTYNFNYSIADIVGAQTGFRLAGWNGTSWKQWPGYTDLYTGGSASYGYFNAAGSITSTAFPLGGNEFTGRSAVNNTYSWRGTVSQDYQTAGNWIPARTNPDPSDRLQFNSGNMDTVKNIPPGQHISRMRASNNTTAILQAGSGAVNTFFTIDPDADSATEEFRVDSGSAVIMNGAVFPLRIAFNQLGLSATTNSLSTIAGRLEIVNTAVDNAVYFGKATVTTSGVIACGGTSGGISISSNGPGNPNPLTVYGSYEHKYTSNTADLPTAVWAAGSNVYITGFTTSTSFAGTGQVYNLTYNCPNQTSVVTTPSGWLPAVAGTMAVVSTGSGTWRLSNSGAFNYSVNNYNQTGGTVDLAASNSSSGLQIMNVAGTFNQSGGVFLSSATLASCMPVLCFNGTGGMQNVSFYNAAPAGPVTYRISNASGISLTGTGALTGAFALNNNGGIQISTAAATPISTGLSLQYTGAASRLIYDAQSSYSADPIVFPALNGPPTLVTNTGNGNVLTLPFSRTLSTGLEMKSGNIQIGANTLTLGTSASVPGTLTYTSGLIQLTTGSFIRWYGGNNQPVTPGNATGFYPVGTAKGYARTAALYFSTSSALTSGGSIGLSLTNTSGLTTGLSVADGGYTINTRSNSGWNFTAANGFAASGSIGERLGASGMISTNVPSDLRAMYAGSVAGTHVNGSVSGGIFYANRTGLSTTDLTAGTHYIGSGSGSGITPVFVSITDGPWNAGATWNTGTVPSATDSVYISPGDTVVVTAASAAKYIQVTAGGTLTNSGNSLAVADAIMNDGTITLSSGSISLGNAGGGNSNFIHNGMLNVAGGNLNINGAVVFSGTVNQSGGTVMIDGNDGTIGGSVISSDMVTINSPAMNLSGGTILIKDPHFDANWNTVKLGANAGGTVSASHSFLFGDGISTTSGKEFKWYNSNNSTQAFKLGNLVINGSASGTGRQVKLVSAAGNMAVAGNVQLAGINAVLNTNTQKLYIGGNLSVNTGDSLVSSGEIIFGTYNAGTAGPVTSLQTVSGSGIFSFVSAGSAANFNALTINNSSAAGVSFLVGDLSYGGTLTFVKGLLNTGAATVINKTTSAVVTAGINTGWIAGKYQQAAQAGAFTIIAPVGDPASYTPVTISGYAAGNGGGLRISAIPGDHPNIGASSIAAAKSVNRYYVVDTVGNPGFVPGSLKASFNWQPVNLDAGASPTAFVAASYNGSSWTSRATGIHASSYTEVTGLGNDISGSYQIGEPNGPPVITQQPVNQLICTATNASFTAPAANASSYQWQVNNGSGWASLANSSLYSGAQSAILLIVAAPNALSNYQYRCKLYNSVDSVISSAAILQVSGSIAPAITISVSPATTICSGTGVVFTATATNGGITPVYQWTRNAIPVGTNSPIFATTSLQNGDLISCTLTSSISCAAPATVTSNTISMTVNPVVSPSISITATPAVMCAGSPVTFVVAGSNIGGAPNYQWKKNGNNVGTGSIVYTDYSLANGDSIVCLLTSSFSPCAPTTTATSNAIIAVVNTAVTPAVSINANPNSNICPGTPVTFTAVPTNGGNVPFFQWKLNGVNADTGINYTTTGLANNDTVTCTMISSAPCVTAIAALSNAVIITISNSLTPTVSISASSTTVCAGSAVSFTATSTNGGSAPAYQWKKNGVNAATGATFTTTSLANNDTITCVLTSSLSCASSAATSNRIIMTIIPSSPVSLNIVASPGTTICPASPVTFTATPTNGGTTPIYQWMKNSVNVGTNSSTFATSAIATGDVITCTVTSNATCPVPVTATSNSLTMNVSVYTPPAITIATGSTTVCAGTAVAFTSAITNTGTPTSYLWKVNRVSTGITTSTYSRTSPVNNDTVTCVLTTTTTCGGTTTTTSNNIVLTVTPATVTSVSIASIPGNSICTGMTDTFTVTSVSGSGTAPVYQWKKNTTNVGTNSTTYIGSSLANGDIITCVMTSNATCPSPAQAISNADTLTVNAPVTPTISVAVVGGTTACSGVAVTFNATIANGGTAPAYQWKRNSINVGTGISYTTSTLATGDTVWCMLTSSAPCATATVVTSNKLIMTINPSTDSISITASPGNSICSGKSVLFVATAVNGGTAPKWQWKVNSTNVGSNSYVYSSSTLKNGDTVICRLTSSATCASPASVNSNAIIMSVMPKDTPSVTITAWPGDTVGIGATVTFTATVKNGGPKPSYQWKKNYVNVGTDTSVYVDPALKSNNIIFVQIISNDSCASPANATSNTISMRMTTGIGTGQNLFSSVVVMPNPSRGSFILKGILQEMPAANVVLEVQSVLGQVVYRESFAAMKGRLLEHPVLLPEAVANGVYILRLSCGDQATMLRISISR